MTKYLSQLAASGARVEIDARSSFVPPAMPRLDEPARQSVLSGSNPDAAGFSVDTSISSGTAVAPEIEIAPGFASPQRNRPSLFPPSSPINLRRDNNVLAGDAAHLTDRSERSTTESDGQVGATSRRFFPSSQQHSSEAISKSNPPADGVVDGGVAGTTASGHQLHRRLEPVYRKLPTASEIIAAAVPSSSRHRAVSRNSPQPPALDGSQREQAREGISDPGDTKHASQKIMAAKFSTAEPDAPTIGRAASTAMFGAITLHSVPRISRAKEPESHITIGRVEVQVNNQPLISPIPARPATNANGNRQDSLQRRFLDRFTLRP